MMQIGYVTFTHGNIYDLSRGLHPCRQIFNIIHISICRMCTVLLVNFIEIKCGNITKFPLQSFLISLLNGTFDNIYFISLLLLDRTRNYFCLSVSIQFPSLLTVGCRSVVFLALNWSSAVWFVFFAYVCRSVRTQTVYVFVQYFSWSLSTYLFFVCFVAPVGCFYLFVFLSLLCSLSILILPFPRCSFFCFAFFCLLLFLHAKLPFCMFLLYCLCSYICFSIGFLSDGYALLSFYMCVLLNPLSDYSVI